jgi:hypothetical protein
MSYHDILKQVDELSRYNQEALLSYLRKKFENIRRDEKFQRRVAKNNLAKDGKLRLHAICKLAGIEVNDRCTRPAGYYGWASFSPMSINIRITIDGKRCKMVRLELKKDDSVLADKFKKIADELTAEAVVES